MRLTCATPERRFSATFLPPLAGRKSPTAQGNEETKGHTGRNKVSLRIPVSFLACGVPTLGQIYLIGRKEAILLRLEERKRHAGLHSVQGSIPAPSLLLCCAHLLLTRIGAGMPTSM